MPCVGRAADDQLVERSSRLLWLAGVRIDRIRIEVDGQDVDFGYADRLGEVVVDLLCSGARPLIEVQTVPIDLPDRGQAGDGSNAPIDLVEVAFETGGDLTALAAGLFALVRARMADRTRSVALDHDDDGLGRERQGEIQ